MWFCLKVFISKFYGQRTSKLNQHLRKLELNFPELYYNYLLFNLLNNITITLYNHIISTLYNISNN